MGRSASKMLQKIPGSQSTIARTDIEVAVDFVPRVDVAFIADVLAEIRIAAADRSPRIVVKRIILLRELEIKELRCYCPT